VPKPDRAAPSSAPGRTPQRYLKAGEVLTSTIEGIGELRHTFVRR
jgi:2-keto-4-pentenoate hydratase/2-oxohepta-3-ene-1,7-dioic acid hydratase in catechol pathway